MNDEELDAAADMRETLEACLDVMRAINPPILIKMVKDSLKTAKFFDLDDPEDDE